MSKFLGKFFYYTFCTEFTAIVAVLMISLGTVWTSDIPIPGNASVATVAIVEYFAVNRATGLYVLLFGIGLTTINGIGLWANKDKKQREKCKNCDRDQLKIYFSRFDDFLRLVAKELNLTYDTDRISVYKFENSYDAFVMLGRYSKHPSFAERSSRGLYPKNEGLISHVWHEGAKELSDLPNPESEMDNYQRKFLDEFNIPEKTTASIRMKSRWYYGYPIEDEKDHRIAVIICESTIIDKDRQGKIAKKIPKQLAHIASFIEHHRSIEPVALDTYIGGV